MIIRSFLKNAAVFMFLSAVARAECLPLKSPGDNPVRGNEDTFAQLLASSDRCPGDVFELRSMLAAAGARIDTNMVSNRGFHNTGSGSLSLFERVSGRLTPSGVSVADGDFFFGHFTEKDRMGKLVASQSPDPGVLMVELIAWDPQKQLYNFYELIGNGTRGNWFYRGDSSDILSDIKLLHLQPNPSQPQFGKRLRCSGCHLSGGPILKELAPHSDWWTKNRPLGFSSLRPDGLVAELIPRLDDAVTLAQSVSAGVARLENSTRFQEIKGSASLREQLRCLFCPVELNLESDTAPLEDRKPAILIPSAFFVDPRLAQDSISVARAHYDAALTKSNARFPETGRHDGDYAWLTPVKAASDILATDALVKQGIIDREFVSDVLAVDATNPVFSNARCKLLRLVPEKSNGNLVSAFTAVLSASADPAAKELLRNLTDPARTAQFHRSRAQKFLNACKTSLAEEEAIVGLYRLLGQRRAEAFASEISKNPKGQILEPGFRVIFPVLSPAPVPGGLRLTTGCKVK